MKINQLLIILLVITSVNTLAQMGINATGTAPNASAMLDISSTTKGLLIPRMNTTERLDILNPANGLLVYDSSEKAIYIYDAMTWKVVLSSAGQPSNIGIGTGALLNNSFARKNVAIGQNALLTQNFVNGNNLYDSKNVAIGWEALKYNNPTVFNNGSYNVGVGSEALKENTIGKHNTGIGYTSMESNTDGIQNTALGSGSLNSNTNGSNNTSIGSSSLNFNTEGQNNVSVGAFANYNNTIGGENVAIGYQSLNSNKANLGSTAVGLQAMLYADDRTVSRLTYNTAVGYLALRGSGIPANNTGQRNTAVGFESLLGNSSGSANVAIGSQSLRGNTLGQFNTAVGDQTLYYNRARSRNTAIGFGAMQNSDNSITTADGFNTALGVFALRGGPMQGLNTGTNNVAIGDLALGNYTSGSNNVALGNGAGGSTTLGSGNIFIGYQAGETQTTSSNLLIIENSNSEQPLIRGDFSGNKVGVNMTKVNFDAGAAIFQVNGNASNTLGGNWQVNSDRRLKKNIKSLNSQEILAKVLNMRGVNYEWNDGNSGKIRPKGTQFGFIAQEIQEIFPTKVSADAKGILSATYGDFDPMLVESIKALKELIDEQKKMLNFQKNTIEAQNVRINNLEQNYLGVLKAEK